MTLCHFAHRAQNKGLMCCLDFVKIVKEHVMCVQQVLSNTSLNSHNFSLAIVFPMQIHQSSGSFSTSHCSSDPTANSNGCHSLGHSCSHHSTVRELTLPRACSQLGFQRRCGQQKAAGHRSTHPVNFNGGLCVACQRDQESCHLPF